MKQFKIAGLCAAGCVLAAAAGAEIIDVKLTACQQGLEGSPIKANVYKSTVVKVRITTKDVLDLIATAYATNFPAGAKLFVADGNAQVLNTNGAVLLDVDAGIFEAEGGEEVYSGLEKDTATGSYSERGSSVGHFYLDVGEDDHFYVGGLVAYQYSEAYSTGKYKTAFSMNAAGDGYFGGDFSVLSGKVTGKGAGEVEAAGWPGLPGSDGRSGGVITIRMPSNPAILPVGTPEN
jgi:hypothetical protein